MNEFMKNSGSYTLKQEGSLTTILYYTARLFIFHMIMLYGLYWYEVIPMGGPFVLLSHGGVLISFLGGAYFFFANDYDETAVSATQAWGYLPKALSWELAISKALIPGRTFPSNHSRKAPPAVEV